VCLPGSSMRRPARALEQRLHCVFPGGSHRRRHFSRPQQRPGRTPGPPRWLPLSVTHRSAPLLSAVRGTRSWGISTQKRPTPAGTPGTLGLEWLGINTLKRRTSLASTRRRRVRGPPFCLDARPSGTVDEVLFGPYSLCRHRRATRSTASNHQNLWMVALGAVTRGGAPSRG
jgi:hypothetical protein